MQDYATLIRQFYEEAETEMLRKVTLRLKRDISEPGWAEKKLAEVKALTDDLSGNVLDLSKVSESISSIVGQAFIEGAQQTVDELRRADINVLPPDWRDVSRAGIRVLAGTLSDTLEQSHFRVLRDATDVYRDVISEGSAKSLTGSVVSKEAVQAALNRFADRGVSRFVDKSGRVWNLATYAEMAVRTTAANARREGHALKMQDTGFDLIIISDSPEECPLCRPWERKILSRTGKTEGYPSLDEAKASGLFHANCSHGFHAYVKGLTSLPESEKETQNELGYEQRQQQRKLERSIRKWKTREAVALDDVQANLCHRKVLEGQSAMREFIEKTGRRRDYDREQVKRGKKTELPSTGTGFKTLSQISEELGTDYRALRSYVVSKYPDSVRKGLTFSTEDERIEILRRMFGPQSRVDVTSYQIPQTSMLQVNSDHEDMAERFGPRHSLSNEQYLGKISENVKKILSETEPVVQISPDNLSKVLDEGRFKNQFETGSTSGILDTNRRKREEKRLFGVPEDVPDEVRPIYAWRLPKDKPQSYGYLQYGESRVVLKDERVRKRATVTFGDSLDVNRESVKAVGMYTDQADHRAFPIKQRKDPLTLNSAKKFWDEDTNYSMLETQIHGGVSVQDIDKVVFTPSRNGRPSEELQGKLRSLDIPYEVHELEWTPRGMKETVVYNSRETTDLYG